MQPLIGEDDVQAVCAYMQSGGWITEHHHTREFERLIAAATQAAHCSATPSGTLAIFLALAACRIGAGDDVIVPDLTMAATASAVSLCGARVQFVDIVRDTLCMDLEAAKAAVTPATRAIIFVSLNGRAPVVIFEIVHWCHERNIVLI